MGKSSVLLVLTLTVLLCGASSAATIGLWHFDEGGGLDALDSSGNGNNGVLGGIGGGGGVPDWVTPGYMKGALDFETDDRDAVVVSHNASLASIQGTTGTAAITMLAWVNFESAVHNSKVFDKNIYALWIQATGDHKLKLRIQVVDAGGVSANQDLVGSGTLPLNEWVYIAGTYDGTDLKLYINGVLDGTMTAPGTIRDATRDLSIGNGNLTLDRPVDGIIDEAALYDIALTQDEIREVMAGTQTQAFEPYPADGQTDVPRDVVLSWEPKDGADTHDVYFGANLSDVADATTASDVYMGRQDPNTYAPGHLDFGQTYYWRVDEVNAAPDFTIFKGNVWSFTVEPYAYPVENVTATASSVNKDIEGPENTVNGAGLDENDLHSMESADMWLSSGIDPNPTWIQYEFDRIYKLHQMLVWNYNSSVEPLVGFGIKEATIEYSVDGTNWVVLGTTHEFAQGPGAVGYAPNTTVELGGLATKYIRINANSNWGGMLNQYGLSEVRFLYIPVWATEPSPDSGATDVSVDAILSFNAGREAARHDVYLSTDEQAVIDGTAPVTTVTEPSYAASLDLASTYYWRVDEVNDAETPTTWQGDIWKLSTQEYIVVDDFESYNDIPTGEEGSNLVYGTWADGFENPANGSTIGYNEPFQPTIETSLVYDGRQSVPLFYDNTVASYSEVTAKVADLGVSQDWSGHGIKALTLRFLGDPNNIAQQMYVKINGSRVAYEGDAENLKRIGWQMWYIDLASTSMSLGNVTELAIGFERIGAVGGQGMVLLDAIRLYSYDRQLITPVEPGATGLQTHYEFEGNTNDSSGNARNGTAMGNPTFVAGKVGQAISFDGLNDYVNIDGYKGITATNDLQPAFSITCWLKTTSADGDMVTWGSRNGSGVGGQYCTFCLNGATLRAEHGDGNLRGNTPVNDGQWHHVALTVVEGGNLRVPNTLLYVDGQPDSVFAGSDNIFNVTADADVNIGRRASHEDRYFIGSIDDVSIYDRVLSEEEVAWLAGRIAPFDKQF